MANSSKDAINTAAPLKDGKKATDCKREHLAAERKWRETRLTILCNINKEAMAALNTQQKMLTLTLTQSIVLHFKPMD